MSGQSIVAMKNDQELTSQVIMYAAIPRKMVLI